MSNLTVNEYWREDWHRGNVHVLVAYDDDYEYRLRRRLEDGIYTVDIARVESTSGEEIGISDEVSEYVTAQGAQDAVMFWGEKLADNWLAGDGF